MKLLYVCGNHGNQRALGNKIADHFPLAAIIVVDPSTKPPTPKRDLRNRTTKLFRRAMRGVASLPLRKAWFGMLNYYNRLNPVFPIEPTLTVGDINAREVTALVDHMKPDLVVVSGSNILKRPLISAIQETAKIMNLHTGISPYIRGGPNCTNWCLTMQRFDLIGNSVMWIDEGIDSGNLIATERTALTGRESLTELHVMVMEHAHDLLLRSMRLFAQGKALPDVPQCELGEGRLFLTRQWNARAAFRATANFYFHYKREITAPITDNVKLVSPEQVYETFGNVSNSE